MYCNEYLPTTDSYIENTLSLVATLRSRTMLIVAWRVCSIMYLLKYVSSQAGNLLEQRIHGKQTTQLHFPNSYRVSKQEKKKRKFEDVLLITP